MELRHAIPLSVGLGLAIPVLSPVLPFVCLAGGIALTVWHFKTRHQPAAGRQLLPMLKILAFVLPVLLVALLVAVALRTDGLQNDFEGYGTMVAFYFGMPLAFATVIVSLVALRRSRQRRFWIPLGVGLLPVLGFCIMFVIAFPWLLLGLAGLAVVGWLLAVLRKRKRGRQLETSRKQLVEAVPPELPVEHLIPAGPVTTQSETPQVRDRRPRRQMRESCRS